MRFYFGRYEWHDDGERPPMWRPPTGGPFYALDLRAPSQGEGYGLFAYPEARSDARLELDLGSDLGVALRGSARERVAEVLSLPSGWATGMTAAQAFSAILLTHADPRGGAVLPVRARLGGRCRIVTAGYEMLNERVGASHPAWIARRELFRVDYRRRRAQVRTQADLDALRRWTGYEVLANRLDGPDDILPLEYRADGALDPRTTITESFNTADSDTLGPDLSWTEVIGDWDVVSNQVQMVEQEPSNAAAARADSDLSSDDHYAQLSVEDIGSFTERLGLGPCTRFDASVYTCYFVYIYQKDDNWYLVRMASGTQNAIANGSGSVSVPAVWKLESDGSTHKVYRDGVQQGSDQTDSNLTGNVRTGINAWWGSTGSAGPIGDDFEAADLGGGGGGADIPHLASRIQSGHQAHGLHHIEVGTV